MSTPTLAGLSDLMTADLNQTLPSTQANLTLISEAMEADLLAVDTETTGLNVTTGEDYLTGISIAFYRGDEIISTYFPFNHVDVNVGQDVKEAVKALIENASALVFHHAKFDIPSLRTVGITISPEQFFYDTMLMAHLIDENRPFTGKGLDSLARYYLRVTTGK